LKASHNLLVSIVVLLSIRAVSAQQADSRKPESAQVTPTSAQATPNEEIANPSGASELPPATPSETCVITPGRLTSGVEIQYPKGARKKHIQGPVVLRATIEKDGTIGVLSIVSGDLGLAEAAVDVVLHEWRYEPYTCNGEPVKVEQDLTFDFRPDQQFVKLDPEVSPRIPVPAVVLQGGAANESVVRAGRGVTAPKPLYTPDPKYDKSARKAKYQGICVLSLIVGPDGTPRDVRVTRALGEGLDVKAVEAVSKWRFEPATKDGKPVASFINVEVTFRLY
jgi:TonB family protein